MLRLLVLFALLGLFAAPVRAQEDLPEPGLVVTNDPYPEDPGAVEYQPGYLYTWSLRSYDGGGALQPAPFTEQHAWFSQVTWGLVEDVDANVILTGTRVVNAGYDFDGDGVGGPASAQGMGDTILGARWQFHASDDQRTAVALLGYLTVPTGFRPRAESPGVSQGYWTLTPRLVASRTWGDFQAVADLGPVFALGSNAQGATNGLSVNLAAGYHLTEQLKPTLEFSYQGQDFAGSPTSESLQVVAGLLVLATENLRFNMGVQFPLAGRNAPATPGAILYLTFDP